MRIKIQVLPTDNVALWVDHRRDMPKDLGSNLSERHIVNLFRCVLYFSATLAKRLKVQFRLGLVNNSTNFIQITAYKYQENDYAKEIESTVDIHIKNIFNKGKCRSKIHKQERERRSDLEM